MRVNAIARLGPRNLQLARATVGVGWRAALTAPSCGACLGYGGSGRVQPRNCWAPIQPFSLHLRPDKRAEDHVFCTDGLASPSTARIGPKVLLEPSTYCVVSRRMLERPAAVPQM